MAETNLAVRKYLRLRNDDAPEEGVEEVSIPAASAPSRDNLVLEKKFWVEPPPGQAGVQNWACESRGARVAVSTNIWGGGVQGQQKLKNVLRFGDLHGTPRFIGGDSTFIFQERTRTQWMLVDLGGLYSLTRIGVSHYCDRWLDRISVYTGTAVQPADRSGEIRYGTHNDGAELPNLSRNMKTWVAAITSLPRDGSIHFDRSPTEARFVLLVVSSGHYYGAGARLGPVFVYGRELWWSFETHHSFPMAFHDVMALIQLVRKSPRDPDTGKEHPFATLPIPLWRKILSNLKSNDWKEAEK
eukprot:scaffold28190_cov40-Prasinocladus_malaysianus.AAC.2